MSHSIRFLGLAILTWAGVRALSLGLVPGTDRLAFDLPAESESQRPELPPIQPSALPPIEPIAAAAPALPGTSPMLHPAYGPYGGGYPYPNYAPYPVYVPVPSPTSRARPPQVRYFDQPEPEPTPINPYFEPVPPVDQWPGMALVAPVPQRQSAPVFTPEVSPAGFDRLQLSSWAMMRDGPSGQALANGGTLGGSQAGARLLWRFNPHLAASLRASAPINSQRGGEAALGVRYQPFMSIPIAITAERRQSIRRLGGRNAFALFAEGGLYGRPLPWNTSLDSYFQGGVVDFNNPDWFVDGQLAVTRPVWRNFSAGVGAWGGAQPDLYRLDFGPRVSMRVGTRMRVHLDYRQKMIGNALPGSGPVLTLAGDF